MPSNPGLGPGFSYVAYCTTVGDGPFGANWDKRRGPVLPVRDLPSIPRVEMRILEFSSRPRAALRAGSGRLNQGDVKS
jgi:hypothetical protein